MSPVWEMDPVDRITAGAVGETGQRTFFVQARAGDRLVSLLCEKQQVALLCELIGRLLEQVEDEDPGDPGLDPGLELEEPLDPEFRVGQMAVGYEADRDLVLVQCDEFVEAEDEDDELVEAEALEEDSEPTGDRWRFWASREQVRALARHGAAVVAAGRPICRMCGGAIDPEGHFCPPSNGHRKVTDLPGV